MPLDVIVSAWWAEKGLDDALSLEGDEALGDGLVALGEDVDPDILD